jgi:hypothetical protein
MYDPKNFSIQFSIELYQNFAKNWTNLGKNFFGLPIEGVWLGFLFPNTAEAERFRDCMLKAIEIS